MKHAHNIQFIFVMGRRPEELSVNALSTFKAIHSRKVSLMSNDDSKFIIRASERLGSLRWSDEAVERVWSWTQGQPYFTQLMCSEIWEAMLQEDPLDALVVGVDGVDNVIRRVLERGGNALQWIWNSLSPAERIVMAAMAESRGDYINQDELTEILNKSKVRLILRELEVAPETLIRWDLLRPVSGGFRFAVPLLRRWVTAEKPLRMVKAELDNLEPLAENLYRSGEGFFSMGNLDESERQLRNALSVNPNHFRARLMLGQVLIGQGNPSAAVEELEPAYEFDPPAAKSGLISALLAVAEMQNENEQLSTFNRILAIDPVQPIAVRKKQMILRERADIAERNEDLEAALKMYQQIDDKDSIGRVQRKLRKRDVEMQIAQAEKYTDVENWSSVIAIYQKLLVKYPDEGDWQTRLNDARTQARLSEMYAQALNVLQQGDSKLAQRLFGTILGTQPDYKDAALYLVVASRGLQGEALLQEMQMLNSRKTGTVQPTGAPPFTNGAMYANPSAPHQGNGQAEPFDLLTFSERTPRNEGAERSRGDAYDHAERYEQQDRFDYADRRDRHDRYDAQSDRKRPERYEHLEEAERRDRNGYRQDRYAPYERPEPPDRRNRYERREYAESDRYDNYEQPHYAERPDYDERPEHSDRALRQERQERQERPTRRQRPEHRPLTRGVSSMTHEPDPASSRRSTEIPVHPQAARPARRQAPEPPIEHVASPQPDVPPGTVQQPPRPTESQAQISETPAPQTAQDEPVEQSIPTITPEQTTPVNMQAERAPQVSRQAVTPQEKQRAQTQPRQRQTPQAKSQQPAQQPKPARPPELPVQDDALADVEVLLDLIEPDNLISPAEAVRATEPQESIAPPEVTISQINTAGIDVGQEFWFDVMTIDENGEEIDSRRSKAYEQIEDIGGIMLEMIYVPAGTFLMGSPADEESRNSNEEPQHQVTVQSMYVGKYPISQAQWNVLMPHNPSRFKSLRRPVENVSWKDAVEFCARLSQRTGHPYRLPSEAEWEYACRAGSTSPFYFGKTIMPVLANYDCRNKYAGGSTGTFRKKTVNAGSFPANIFGLYDMHGNVWEWCADGWHRSYQGAPTDGSAWEAEGRNNFRIMRGGSWGNAPRDCRSASRDRNEMDSWFNNAIGFRVVVAASEWNVPREA